MATFTLEDALNSGDPAKIASALQAIAFGSALKAPIVLDTGTINPASATVTLDPPALLVQSARIVASGTAGSVGTYLVGDNAAIPVSVAGGASAAAGVAKVSTDGTTITFPNTVTQAVIQYVPRPDVSVDYPIE